MNLLAMYLFFWLNLHEYKGVDGDQCYPCSCNCPSWINLPGHLLCVDCNNRNLTSVPSFPMNLTKNIGWLILYDNRITTLESGIFNGFSSLKGLNLGYNGICSFSKIQFDGLKTLEVLNLQENEFTSIPENAFNGLPSLMRLFLNYNTITNISEGGFNGLVKLIELYLYDNKIERLHSGTFKDMLALAILDLSNNKILHIERNIFLPLRNLFRLILQGNIFKDIPSALWTTRLSHVTVHLDDNPFNCSCKLLNELKQLEHTVKRLQPTASYYEQQCTNVTSNCEEERNFALAMNVGHNCLVPNNAFAMSFLMQILESEFALTDGNTSTYGICNNYMFSLPVDLPGVIVLTKVVMVVSSLRGMNGTISIAVGDKLSNTYKSCTNFPLTTPTSSGTMTIQGTCTTTPSGRDVRVDVSVNPSRGSGYGISINVHEIRVNGYEKNKYNLWSNWNQWGPCSTTCGNGLRRRNRTCTNTTSLSCVLPGHTNKRSPIHIADETCNLEPCFQALYQWTIGGVAGVFVLTVFGIIFWYRKFKMIRYFEGLRPNPNFELDPNKTLLEQIEELPYDLHWEFPRYDVRFGSIIGEGHFGRVWLAKAKGIRGFNPRDHSDLSSRAKLAKLQDQRVHDYFTTVTESWLLGDCDTTHYYDVAVKTLKECATPKHQMDLASELKLLIYIDRHPNIVNLLASCTIRGDLWVIMEYCDHGSLKKFLSDRQTLFTPTWSKNSVDMSSEICFFDLLEMTQQIANGVMFLHCWKIVHRDLSARNILVDANFNLKIADFGLARSENFVAPSDDILPIKWSSLESLLRHEYTTKSDIWSIAVLYWEVFSFGEVPYPGMSSKEVIQQLKEGYRMSSPDQCPEEIWNIISDCWSREPDCRPSAMELFEQLYEVKVSLCSPPDGQYYGASRGEYGQAGSVEGPSFEDITKNKVKAGFEGKCNKTFANVHKTSTEDAVEESGPSTISYREYRVPDSENYNINENKNMKKNREEIKTIIGGIEKFKRNEEEIKTIVEAMEKFKKNGEEIKSIIEAIEIFKKNGEEIKTIIEEIEKFRKNGAEIKTIIEAMETFKKNGEEIKTIEAMEKLMKNGKEIKTIIEEMEKFEKNGEEIKTINEVMEVQDESFKKIKDIADNYTEIITESRTELSDGGTIDNSNVVSDTDIAETSHTVVCMDIVELKNLSVDTEVYSNHSDDRNIDSTDAVSNTDAPDDIENSKAVSDTYTTDIHHLVVCVDVTEQTIVNLDEIAADASGDSDAEKKSSL